MELSDKSRMYRHLEAAFCMEELFSASNYYAAYIFPRFTTLIPCTLIDALLEAAPIHNQM